MVSRAYLKSFVKWPVGLALAALLVAATAASAQQVVGRAPPRVTAASSNGPGWPQTWTANEREPASYAIAVTQPGMITVTVNAQGTPVLVALYGAGPQAVAQQASSGSFRLSYQVTPENVRNGLLWRVQIGVTQAPGRATGTIAIDQPPADPQKVGAMLRGLKVTHANVPATAGAKAAASAALQARKALFDQKNTARRTALHVAIKSKLSPGMTLRPIPTLAGRVTSRGLTPEKPIQPYVVTKPSVNLPFPPPSPPYIASIVNGEGTQQVLPGDPVVITGSGFGPNDNGAYVEFVMLNTTGAYSLGGGPVIAWSDLQILVDVPYMDGFSGPVPLGIIVHPYGRPASAQTTGFTLLPLMDLVGVPTPPTLENSYVHKPDTNNYYADDSATNTGPGINTGTADLVSDIPDGWHDGVVWENQADWLGDKGDDQFYMQTVLAPGWTVYSAEVDVQTVYACLVFSCIKLAGTDPQAQNYAYAYMIDGGGAFRPWIKVHVWENAFNSVEYTISVWVIGPKNTNPFLHP
jgi:hypothetical protein